MNLQRGAHLSSIGSFILTFSILAYRLIPKLTEGGNMDIKILLVVLLVTIGLNIASQIQKRQRNKSRKGGRLVIVHAAYGSDVIPIWNNVTETVKAMMIDGALKIQGKYNNVFGPDPAKHIPKELKLDYLCDGEKFCITASENANFTLPS